jgi:hypothetical protein
MTATPERDVDRLAHALARLLATWWQMRAANAPPSRAPPAADIAQRKGTGGATAVISLVSSAEREAGGRNEPGVGF